MKSNICSEFNEKHKVTITIPVLSNNFLFMANLYRIENERPQQIAEYTQCIKWASLVNKSRSHKSISATFVKKERVTKP